MITSPARRRYQRQLLARKRADPTYRAAERKRRAAQMNAVRQKRRAAGLCHDCDQPTVPGRHCCARHLRAERRRGRMRRAAVVR